MNVREAIQSRYSVRAYKPKPVEPDVLDRVLQAARLAPSGNNKQAYKFIVVRELQMRKAITALTGQKWMVEAPVILAAVSLEPDRLMSCGIPAGPVDVAIALDHITLAATEEGLGCCWIGHFPQDPCKQLLNVPETARIIELMALGYSNDKAQPQTKSRKPLSELVCYDLFR